MVNTKKDRDREGTLLGRLPERQEMQIWSDSGAMSGHSVHASDKLQTIWHLHISCFFGLLEVLYGTLRKIHELGFQKRITRMNKIKLIVV